MEKKRKVGGYGGIRGRDNPKPFTKDYNSKNFEKWTEERVHSILDELEEWLLEEDVILDDDGNIIGTVDSGNCFWQGFLYKKKLYSDWIGYVRRKFDSVKKRLESIGDITEYKLQLLAATGVQKESITKFILTNKYNWKEKTQNENTNTDIIWNEVRKKE